MPASRSGAYWRMVAEAQLATVSLRDGRPWAHFDEAAREQTRRDEEWRRAIARAAREWRAPVPEVIAMPSRMPRGDPAERWRLYLGEHAAFLASVREAAYAAALQDRLVALHGPHWHALLLERLVTGRAGQTVATAEIALIVELDIAGPEEARAAAAAHAGLLFERGYLGLTGRSAESVYGVLADSDAAAVADTIVRAARARAEADEARRQAGGQGACPGPDDDVRGTGPGRIRRTGTRSCEYGDASCQGAPTRRGPTAAARWMPRLRG